MEQPDKFQEKRKSPRLELSALVEYRMLRAGTETKKESVLSDISAGGARFMTKEFLALTARMVLDITLPLPERPISAVSKVAWIKKLQEEDKYEMGNQFLEISRDDKERLANYLDRMVKV